MKPKPKIVTRPVYEENALANASRAIHDTEAKPLLTAPVTNQVFKPKSPTPNLITSLQQHYQFLHNEYLKQKQDRYNKLCSNTFSTRAKKR